MTAPIPTGDVRIDVSETLRLAAEAARVFSWVWHIPSDTLIWTPSAEPLLGPLPPSGKYPDFREMVHPDDRESYLAVGRRAMATLTEYEREFRIVRTDGAVRWLHGRGKAYAGASGSAERMIGVTVDIHDRKTAELALGESEARFRDFARASADWFWETDTEHRFTWFSDALERVLGLSPTSLIGKRREEVAAEAPSAPGWKDLQETLGRHEPFRDFRYPIAAPAGPCWLSVSGVPVFAANGTFLGYRGVASDITREVSAVRSAEAARRRLQLVMDRMPIGCVLRDGNLRYTYWNPAAERIFGHRAEDVIGKTPYEVTVPPEARAQVEAVMREVQNGRDTRNRNLNRTKDGRLIVCEWHNSPLYDESGALIAHLAMVLDVTDQVRNEQSLRDLTANLERRVVERTSDLERAMRELEAFSYSVSHDLRAPLRAISGFARMLLEDEAARLSEEGRRHLGRVERNAVRMGELIDDLLALARVNRADVRRRPVDIAALAAAIAKDLQAAHPGTTVEIGAMPGADCDATLLRQALVNLLDNAFKFSSRSDAPRIETGWSDSEQAYYVRDNGVGFDMQFADQLFGTFQRLHDGAQFEGTGIGLAIVKRVLDRHGGRAWATSAPGAGATFYFQLGGEPARG